MVTRRLVVAAAMVFLGAAFLVSSASAQEAPKPKVEQGSMEKGSMGAEMAPSIVGTWLLMSRDLPDGTKQVPPAVSGMLTYTAKYRNFNVMWRDAAGKAFSISYVAGYTLTPTEYTETPIMRVMTNEAGPEKVSYTWPAETGKPNPVTIKDGAITFPIAGEPPVITFQGDEMTAVAKGQFTDHWKKVAAK